MDPFTANSLGFQSTPPVKAATRRKFPAQLRVGISIHAAREGGDEEKSRFNEAEAISIHAAREGGDSTWAAILRGQWRFQSTPPVKAATRWV